MRFTGITALSWYSVCSLSSVFVIALAGPTLAEPPSSPHGSPHGGSSYSGKHPGGQDKAHMGFSAHGDKHYSKGYPSMGDSNRAMGFGHGGGQHGMGRRGHSATHQGATEFIDHILKFKDGMSVTDEQEQQLRSVRTNYRKDRIKIKANVQLANIDLHELLRDNKSSLGDIERNLKNVYALKADLNMASIKAKRDAKAVLSEEQQSRMDTIHERIKSHGGNMSHASGYSRSGKGKDNY